MKKSTISSTVLCLKQDEPGTEYALWSEARKTWFMLHNMDLVPSPKYEWAHKFGYGKPSARKLAERLLESVRNGDKFELF